MDDEPLFLDIEIIGADKAMQHLQSVSKSIKGMQSPLSAASDKTQKMTRNLQSAVGPAQRLAKALTELRVAQQGGRSNASVFDAQYRAMQAQKSFNRAQNAMNPHMPSFGSKLLDVFKSSRFGLGGGAGGGLMPLVGKTLELLGPEVTIAVAAIGAMAAMAREAAESLTTFRESMVTSGGSAGEVGRLNAYGSAAGVGDTAGLSRQLADRLADNGTASAFGQQAGIHDYGGGFSDLDKARNLQKAIDYMLDPRTSEVAALRFARVEGLEAFMKLRGISQETKAALDEVGRQNALVHSDSAMKSAAEFNAQMAIAGTNFDTLSTTLGSSFLPSFTGTVALFNDFAPAINNTLIALKPLVDLLMRFTPMGMLSSLHDAITEIREALGEKHASAIDRNTEALNANTSATARAGTYGGGDRARGAEPGAWGGSNSHQWANRNATLGAFDL